LIHLFLCGCRLARPSTTWTGTRSAAEHSASTARARKSRAWRCRASWTRQAAPTFKGPTENPSVRDFFPRGGHLCRKLPGWPDWTSFCPLGSCLFWTAFWKIQKLCKCFFPQYKLCIIYVKNVLGNFLCNFFTNSCSHLGSFCEGIEIRSKSRPNLSPTRPNGAGCIEEGSSCKSQKECSYKA
jgi:hypothetical protein